VPEWIGPENVSSAGIKTLADAAHITGDADARGSRMLTDDSKRFRLSDCILWTRTGTFDPEPTSATLNSPPKSRQSNLGPAGVVMTTRLG
jgi:hypothetical protein